MNRYGTNNGIYRWIKLYILKTTTPEKLITLQIVQRQLK